MWPRLVFLQFSQIFPAYRTFASLLIGRSVPFGIHGFALRWRTPERTYMIRRRWHHTRIPMKIWGCNMLVFARRLFPRAQDMEALVALSAVVAGAVGSIATLVTVAMMLSER